MQNSNEFQTYSENIIFFYSSLIQSQIITIYFFDCSWPPELETNVNAQNPLEFSEDSSIYLSSSPPPFWYSSFNKTPLRPPPRPFKTLFKTSFKTPSVQICPVPKGIKNVLSPVMPDGYFRPKNRPLNSHTSRLKYKICS